jgi:hypothetical protein
MERNRTRVEDADAGKGSNTNLIAPVDGEIVSRQPIGDLG